MRRLTVGGKPGRGHSRTSGQGATSRDRFAALTADAKAKLLAFLRSL